MNGIAPKYTPEPAITRNASVFLYIFGFDLAIGVLIFQIMRESSIF